MTYPEDFNEDGELNALLADLPQPAPSAALDAAILASAQKALADDAAKPVAANDSADGVRSLPAKRDYLQRWRMPLGLAAAVLLTVNMIGIDWFGSKPAQFPVVGEPVTPTVPPQTEAMTAPAPAPAMDAAPVSPAPAPPPAPAPMRKPSPVQKSVPMAEQSVPSISSVQNEQLAPPLPGMPAPLMSRTAPAPVIAPAPAPAPARLDASVWLLKIDALLKAGQAQVAQEEWRAFRQSYPDYPVEQQLRERLEAPAR